MGAKPKPVFVFDSVFFFVQEDDKKKKKNWHRYITQRVRGTVIHPRRSSWVANSCKYANIRTPNCVQGVSRVYTNCWSVSVFHIIYYTYQLSPGIEDYSIRPYLKKKNSFQHNFYR